MKTVRVYFAHGVKFKFRNVLDVEAQVFRAWAKKEKKWVLEYRGHCLNNDFLCAMRIDD